MKIVFLTLIVCVARGHSVKLHSSLETKSVGEWTFTLYKNGTPNGTTNIAQANSSARTVVIIHGWQQRGTQSWIMQMKNVYLSISSTLNVIILDWSRDALKVIYSDASSAVPNVGIFLGNHIYEWETAGIINVTTTKVIGFSLGAHVAGIAAQQYQKLTNGKKLPDIVGLEPAGLDFETKPNDERLDVSDAEMVQVFHTSLTGISARCGRVDVYFNYNFIPPHCGTLQPGCPLNPGVPMDSLLAIALCDHIRSAALYIESIRSSNFLAVSCSTCGQFGSDNCNTSLMIVVGEQLPLTTPNGAYYLRTSSRSPFALGTDGTQA